MRVICGSQFFSKYFLSKSNPSSGSGSSRAVLDVQSGSSELLEDVHTLPPTPPEDKEEPKDLVSTRTPENGHESEKSSETYSAAPPAHLTSATPEDSPRMPVPIRGIKEEIVYIDITFEVPENPPGHLDPCKPVSPQETLPVDSSVPIVCNNKKPFPVAIIRSEVPETVLLQANMPPDGLKSKRRCTHRALGENSPVEPPGISDLVITQTELKRDKALRKITTCKGKSLKMPTPIVEPKNEEIEINFKVPKTVENKTANLQEQTEKVPGINSSDKSLEMPSHNLEPKDEPVSSGTTCSDVVKIVPKMMASPVKHSSGQVGPLKSPVEEEIADLTTAVKLKDKPVKFGVNCHTLASSVKNVVSKPQNAMGIQSSGVEVSPATSAFSPNSVVVCEIPKKHRSSRKSRDHQSSGKGKEPNKPHEMTNHNVEPKDEPVSSGTVCSDVVENVPETVGSRAKNSSRHVGPLKSCAKTSSGHVGPLKSPIVNEMVDITTAVRLKDEPVNVAINCHTMATSVENDISKPQSAIGIIQSSCDKMSPSSASGSNSVDVCEVPIKKHRPSRDSSKHRSSGKGTQHQSSRETRDHQSSGKGKEPEKPHDMPNHNVEPKDEPVSSGTVCSDVVEIVPEMVAFHAMSSSGHIDPLKARAKSSSGHVGPLKSPVVKEMVDLKTEVKLKNEPLKVDINCHTMASSIENVVSKPKSVTGIQSSEDELAPCSSVSSANSVNVCEIRIRKYRSSQKSSEHQSSGKSTEHRSSRESSEHQSSVKSTEPNKPSEMPNHNLEPKDEPVSSGTVCSDVVDILPEMVASCGKNSSGHVGSLKSRSKNSSGHVGPVKSRAKNSSGHVGPLKFSVVEERVDPAAAVKLKEEPAKVGELSKRQSVMGIQSSGEEVSPPSSASSSNSVDICEIPNKKHRSSQKSSEHQSSGKSTEHRSSRENSEHRSSGKGTEHRSSQKSSEHRSSGKGTEHRSSQDSSEHQSSVKSTEPNKPSEMPNHNLEPKDEPVSSGTVCSVVVDILPEMVASCGKNSSGHVGALKSHSKNSSGHVGPVKSRAKNSSGHVGSLKSRSKNSSGHVGPVKSRAKNSSGHVGPLKFPVVEEMVDPAAAVKLKEEPAKVGELSKRQSVMGIQSSGEEVSPPSSAFSSNSVDICEIPNKKHRSSQKSSKHQSSGKGTEHRSSRENSEHRSSGKGTEHRSSQKSSEHRSSGKGTENRSSRDSSKLKSSENGTEHRSSQKRSEHRSSGKGPENRSSRGSSEHKSSGNGTEQGSSQKSSEHRSSGKGTEHRSAQKSSKHQSSGKGTEHRSSCESSKNTSSGNGTEHCSSQKSSKPRSSGKGTENQSSRESSEDRSSGNGTERRSSQKSSEHLSSRKGTENPSSRESSEDRSSENGTEHCSSQKSSEPRSSGKGTENRSSRESSDDRSSGNGTEHGSSQKSSEHRSSGKGNEHRSSREKDRSSHDEERPKRSRRDSNNNKNSGNGERHSAEDIPLPAIAGSSNADLEVDGPSQVLAWMADASKEFVPKLGSPDIKELENMVSIYLSKVSSCISKCYVPNRAAKMKRSMNDVLMLFNLIYQDIAEDKKIYSTYLDQMTELMAYYIDMEIQASSRAKENPLLIAGKLASSLFIFLNKSHDHILDSILKANNINKNFWELCSMILSTVLKEPPKTIMSELTYVRYILAYKMWKRVVQGAEERKRVMSLASLRLRHPPQFVDKTRAGLLNGIIPKIPKKRGDVTTFLIQAKFDVKEKSKAFLKYVSESKTNVMFVPAVPAIKTDIPLLTGYLPDFGPSLSLVKLDPPNIDEIDSDQKNVDMSGSRLMNEVWTSINHEASFREAIRMQNVTTFNRVEAKLSEKRRIHSVLKHKKVVKDPAGNNTLPDGKKVPDSVDTPRVDSPEVTIVLSDDSDSGKSSCETVEIPKKSRPSKVSKTPPMVRMKQERMSPTPIERKKDKPSAAQEGPAEVVLTPPVAKRHLINTSHIKQEIETDDVIIMESPEPPTACEHETVADKEIIDEDNRNGTVELEVSVSLKKTDVSQPDSPYIVPMSDRFSKETAVVLNEKSCDLKVEKVMEIPTKEKELNIRINRDLFDEIKRRDEFVKDSTTDDNPKPLEISLPISNSEQCVGADNGKNGHSTASPDKKSDNALFDDEENSWSPSGGSQEHIRNVVDKFISRYLPVDDVDIRLSSSSVAPDPPLEIHTVAEDSDMPSCELFSESIDKSAVDQYSSINVQKDTAPEAIDGTSPPAKRCRISEDLLSEAQVEETVTVNKPTESNIASEHLEEQFSNPPPQKEEEFADPILRAVHNNTCRWDHICFVLQTKLRDVLPTNITAPIPSPVEVEPDTGRPVARCSCNQCLGNYKALMFNHKALVGFQNDVLKASRESENEGGVSAATTSAVTTTSHLFAPKQEDDNLEQEEDVGGMVDSVPQLPFKKRKALVSSSGGTNDDGESIHSDTTKDEMAVDYPATPMLSIALLENHTESYTSPPLPECNTSGHSPGITSFTSTSAMSGGKCDSGPSLQLAGGFPRIASTETLNPASLPGASSCNLAPPRAEHDMLSTGFDANYTSMFQTSSFSSNRPHDFLSGYSGSCTSRPPGGGFPPFSAAIPSLTNFSDSVSRLEQHSIDNVAPRFDASSVDRSTRRSTTTRRFVTPAQLKQAFIAKDTRSSKDDPSSDCEPISNSRKHSSSASETRISRPKKETNSSSRKSGRSSRKKK